MKLCSVNEFLSNPLAGCDSQFKDIGSYITFRDSLCMRLALFYNREIAAGIVSEIEIESDFRPVQRNEYCINEILYELRRAAKNLLKGYTEEFETNVLNDWGRMLIKKHDADDVLDFITKVKFARYIRDRY